MAMCFSEMDVLFSTPCFQVPVLFSKAIEIFIMELTMRAWLHTEDNKRRTVQVGLNFLVLEVFIK